MNCHSFSFSFKISISIVRLCVPAAVVQMMVKMSTLHEESVLLTDILMIYIHQCRHETTGGVEISCRLWLDVSGNDVMMITSFV